MKVLKCASVLPLLFAIASVSGAQVPETASPHQLSRQEQELRDLGVYMNAPTPTTSNRMDARYRMRTEKKFLEQIRIHQSHMMATGSGNGGDPIAVEFVNLVRRSFANCGPENTQAIAAVENLQIRNVPFNLCVVDDSSDCSAANSLALKFVPDFNLVMINVHQWSGMSPARRANLAATSAGTFFGVQNECLKSIPAN